MEPMTLKAGDLVKCVTPGPYKVTQGEAYIIETAYTQHGDRFVTLTGDDGADVDCWASRFEKVPTKFQVGDRVLCTEEYSAANGFFGTIVSVEHDWAWPLVDFEGFTEGHAGHGFAKDPSVKSMYFVDVKALTLAPVTEVPFVEVADADGEPAAANDNPTSTQVGGTHYSDMAIQPIDFILANKLPFSEGSVIKYVSRWRSKGGVEDLKKARHFLDMLIQHEETAFAA